MREAGSESQAARGKVAGSQGRTKRPIRSRSLPQPVRSELAGDVGATKAPRMELRMGEAVRAYERDRYREAAQVLRPLAEAAPGAPAVRELYGLTLYRLGRWNDAIRELEAFRSISGSFDQHPTLADCYRAKRRWGKVEALWEELREASPSAELVAEGRIVAAGARADKGDITSAIDLLERAAKETHRPKDHHVRSWYALADLYERAGQIPRARELFRRVVDVDPELSDAVERLSGLN